MQYDLSYQMKIKTYSFLKLICINVITRQALNNTSLQPQNISYNIYTNYHTIHTDTNHNDYAISFDIETNRLD
jgi:hypothetical protein